jgi:hypothetical protein
VKVFGGAALLVAVLVLILLPGCGDSKDDSNTQPGSNGAEIVSASSLRTALAGEATPIYWAGERRGTKLELSQPSRGRTYVRYLTGDAEAGDRRANFLTVSTYAQPNAVAALRRQGKRSGGTVRLAPGNATVYFDRTDPGSVYLAYPGVPVEIEVYDPSFKRALQLVNSGQIVAVG